MNDYGGLPNSATLQPSKFNISIPEDSLSEFKQLLKLSKIGPKTFENGQEDQIHFGVSHKWMSETKQYWQDKFDWRKREAHFNTFPHFTTPVKGDDGTLLTIHFVALFSQKPNAIPIVFLHGWPGSFLEFLDILSILKARYTPHDLPYNVIVPSLPGYTFSEIPLDKNFKTEDMASMMHNLMVGLGFGSGYVVQGGDLGSFVARVMVVKYESCKAMHINFCILLEPPKGVSMDTVTQPEQQGLARAKDFSTTGNAYAIEHATRPATIGLVLSASPVALLAWIGEKFLTWTDKDPSLETILDSVTLYWFTQSFPRAIYPYRQYMVPPAKYFHPDAEYYCGKPMGYSYFPMELAPIPKSWVETTGKLVWYREHKSGGHFAAVEEPENLLQDVEDFVKQVWTGK